MRPRRTAIDSDHIELSARGKMFDILDELMELAACRTDSRIKHVSELGSSKARYVDVEIHTGLT